MRLLGQHHIVNLVAVVDAFLRRNASNPKGGRPVKLHQNETIALLLFSSMVAPQRTMQGASLGYAQWIKGGTHFGQKLNHRIIN